ncbi:MAG TPA: glycosyltransferase [Gemmatimonadaceae bacterium]
MFLLLTAAVAFGLLAIAWVVYPAAMWLRARTGRGSTGTSRTPDAAACVVVATRDDPAFAVERVRNLRGGDYPVDRLQVVIAVDPGAPFPFEAYHDALAGLAEVVPGDRPGGKAATLNAGVRAAAGCDALVFADVGQEFSPDAIRRLVLALESGLEGVTGRYTHHRTDAVMTAWSDFEAVIRAGQAASRSVVSATGAVLAMRPAYWRDLPAGLICDDLFTGLSIVRQGGRVGFCPEAVAFDPRPFSQDQQFARRARTLTGLIQYCAVVPGVLLPWRNPVWLHFVVHKLLRLLTPVLLAVGLLATLVFLALRVPMALSAVAAATLLVVLLGVVIAPAAFRRIRNQALWMLRLQLVPVVAIANGLRGRWAVWNPTPQGRGELPHGT